MLFLLKIKDGGLYLESKLKDNPFAMYIIKVDKRENLLAHG